MLYSRHFGGVNAFPRCLCKGIAMQPPRTLTLPERLVHRFLISDAGIWFGRYILPRLDRPLLYLTRGRYSMSKGQPILLLINTGARTGKRRATPLLYQHDGDRLIVLASNGGRARHPAWYHNVQAHPAVVVYAEGRIRTYAAHEATGDERARLWAAAVDFFGGYDLYAERSRRNIPVIVLTPQ